MSKDYSNVYVSSDGDIMTEMSNDIHTLFEPILSCSRACPASEIAGIVTTLRKNFDVITTGSSVELPGLFPESDVDIMYLVGDIDGEDDGTGRHLILSSQDAMHPGYLQLFDRNGQIHRHADMPGFENRDVDIVTWEHGPALGALKGAKESDNVLCYNCKKWPSQAKSWLHRTRASNWPSQQQIGEIQKLGSNLVRIGHPSSPHPENEWRLSFSQAEKYLLQSLPCVQVLVLFLARRILGSIKKENSDNMCSFYVKTLFLWQCEERFGEYWRPTNMIQAAVDVITRLIQCLENHCLENYFVPENNIIDHLPFDSLTNIAHRLKKALQTDSLVQLFLNIFKEHNYKTMPKGNYAFIWQFVWLPFPLYHAIPKGQLKHDVKSGIRLKAMTTIIGSFQHMLEAGFSLQEMEIAIAVMQTKISTTANFKALGSTCAIIFLGLCLEHNLIPDPASHFTLGEELISWAIENTYELPAHLSCAINSNLSDSRDLSRAANLVKGPEDSFFKARILFAHAIKMLPEFSSQLRCAITSTYYTQGDYLEATYHAVEIDDVYVYPEVFLEYHPTYHLLGPNERRSVSCTVYATTVYIECCLRLGEYEIAHTHLKEIITNSYVDVYSSEDKVLISQHVVLNWYLIFLSLTLRWGANWMKKVL